MTIAVTFASTTGSPSSATAAVIVIVEPAAYCSRSMDAVRLTPVPGTIGMCALTAYTVPSGPAASVPVTSSVQTPGSAASMW